MKMKKMPKSPKQSASLETWQRHEQKVKEVNQMNAKMKSDAAKKKALITKVRKEKAKK